MIQRALFIVTPLLFVTALLCSSCIAPLHPLPRRDDSAIHDRLKPYVKISAETTAEQPGRPTKSIANARHSDIPQPDPLAVERILTLDRRQRALDADARLGPFGGSMSRGFSNLLNDQRNFYSFENLYSLGMATLHGSIVANSEFDITRQTADTQFQDFVRRKLHGRDSAKFLDQVEVVGDYTLTVPAIGLLAMTAHALDGLPMTSTISEWGYRSLRAVLVGEPALLIMQKATGASRPNDGGDSRWNPGADDNGVSGHAFIGAIPFLTAARMSKKWYLRYPLIALSVVPAWARVHNDDHYFSQALLGWWLAYRSVESVEPGRRDRPGSDLLVAPLFIPEGAMVAVFFSF